MPTKSFLDKIYTIKDKVHTVPAPRKLYIFVSLTLHSHHKPPRGWIRREEFSVSPHRVLYFSSPRRLILIAQAINPKPFKTAGYMQASVSGQYCGA